MSCFSLCLKTSLGAQPFMFIACSLPCKLMSFSYERLYNRTRFKTGRNKQREKDLLGLAFPRHKPPGLIF